MYDRTIKACLARESSQWEIGDALIDECGPPGKDGANNGSFDKIKEVVNELADKGVVYTPGALRNLRDVSYAWPAPRGAGISWSVYRVFMAKEYRRLLKDRIRDNPDLTMTLAKAQEIVENVKKRAALREEAASDNNESPAEPTTTNEEDKTQYVPDEPAAPVMVPLEIVSFQKQSETAWAAVADLVAAAEKLGDKEEADKAVEAIRVLCADYFKDRAKQTKSTRRTTSKAASPASPVALVARDGEVVSLH